MRVDVSTVVVIVCQQLMFEQYWCLSVSLSSSGSYASLGDRFKFTCRVTYDDSLTQGTVSFTRNGATVSSISTKCTGGRSDFGFSHSCSLSGVHHLEISRVSLKDDATWKCRRDTRGSNSIRLYVYYGPDKVTLDTWSPKTVVESSSLEVQCTTSCEPCSMTWNKGLLTVSNTGTLRFNNIQRSQAGDYTCKATNTKTGKSVHSSTFRVNVQYTPEVTIEAPGFSSCRPFRVYVGQNYIQLTCRVIASDPEVASYVWTRNGLTVSTSSVYSISTVSKSSAGTYTCAGRNSAGTSSKPAKLEVDVQYAPSVSLPSFINVTEEKTLNLYCSVDSNPTASVKWTKKDGGDFTPRTGSTLTMVNIQKEQEGTYACTASNTLRPCSGSAPASAPVSKEVLVHVEYKRTYIVTEFTHLEINCSKYRPDIDPNTATYEWTGPGDFNFTGPVLYINNINRTLTGKYNCTINNSLTVSGESSQTVVEKFKVDVHYPAVITSYTINSGTDNLTVNEFDHVNMKCHVDSNPGSTIRFHNGSTDLTVSHNSLAYEYSWVAHCRQRGYYSCTASNGVGTSSSGPIRVLVNCSPRVESATAVHTKFELSLGSNITLLVEFLSYPEPIITWSSTDSTRNLTAVSSVRYVSDVSAIGYLTLNDIHEEDFGHYQVEAENTIGKSPVYTFELVLASGAVTSSTGLIVGVTVGVMVLIAVVVSVVIALLRRKLRLVQIVNCHSQKANSTKRPTGKESQLTNQYEELSKRQPDSETYTELKTYGRSRTTGVSEKENVYDEIDSTRDPYEGIKPCYV